MTVQNPDMAVSEPPRERRGPRLPKGPQSPEKCVATHSVGILCEVCGRKLCRCGQLFLPKVPWQEHCSDSCRNRARDARTPRFQVRGHRPNRQRERKAGASIQCPSCKGWWSHVEDTRGCEGYIWRKRECLSCGFEFATNEWPVGKGGGNGTESR